jgi:hypothetical protein
MDVNILGPYGWEVFEYRAGLIRRPSPWLDDERHPLLRRRVRARSTAAAAAAATSDYFLYVFDA